MKKQNLKPLKLRTETVRVLLIKDLIAVGGGSVLSERPTNHCNSKGATCAALDQ